MAGVLTVCGQLCGVRRVWGASVPLPLCCAHLLTCRKALRTPTSSVILQKSAEPPPPKVHTLLSGHESDWP